MASNAQESSTSELPQSSESASRGKRKSYDRAFKLKVIEYAENLKPGEVAHSAAETVAKKTALQNNTVADDDKDPLMGISLFVLQFRN